jgi:hypothetical protein
VTGENRASPIFGFSTFSASRSSRRHDRHGLSRHFFRYNPTVRACLRQRLSGRQGRTWMSMLDMMMVGGVVVLIVLIVARKRL